MRVGQFLPIFLCVLVRDFSQFFLPQPRILSFIDDAILIYLGFNVVHQGEHPAGVYFYEILIDVACFLHEHDKLIDESAIVKKVHTLFKRNRG